MSERTVVLRCDDAKIDGHRVRTACNRVSVANVFDGHTLGEVVFVRTGRYEDDAEVFEPAQVYDPRSFVHFA